MHANLDGMTTAARERAWAAFRDQTDADVIDGADSELFRRLRDEWVDDHAQEIAEAFKDCEWASVGKALEARMMERVANEIRERVEASGVLPEEFLPDED